MESKNIVHLPITKFLHRQIPAEPLVDAQNRKSLVRNEVKEAKLTPEKNVAGIAQQNSLVEVLMQMKRIARICVR